MPNPEADEDSDEDSSNLQSGPIQAIHMQVDWFQIHIFELRLCAAAAQIYLSCEQSFQRC